MSRSIRSKSDFFSKIFWLYKVFSSGDVDQRMSFETFFYIRAEKIIMFHFMTTSFLWRFDFIHVLWRYVIPFNEKSYYSSNSSIDMTQWWLTQLHWSNVHKLPLYTILKIKIQKLSSIALLIFLNFTFFSFTGKPLIIHQVLGECACIIEFIANNEATSITFGNEVCVLKRSKWRELLHKHVFIYYHIKNNIIVHTFHLAQVFCLHNYLVYIISE